MHTRISWLSKHPSKATGTRVLLLQKWAKFERVLLLLPSLRGGPQFGRRVPDAEAAAGGARGARVLVGRRRRRRRRWTVVGGRTQGTQRREGGQGRGLRAPRAPQSPRPSIAGGRRARSPDICCQLSGRTKTFVEAKVEAVAQNSSCGWAMLFPYFPVPH